MKDSDRSFRRSVRKSFALMAYQWRALPRYVSATIPILLLFSMHSLGRAFWRDDGSASILGDFSDGTIFTLFAVLTTMFLAYPEYTFRLEPSAGAHAVFPLTRAVGRRQFFRARLMLIASFLLLPVLIATVYAFARPDITLRASRLHKEAATDRSLYAWENNQFAKQRLYLEGLEGAEVRFGIPLLKALASLPEEDRKRIAKFNEVSKKLNELTKHSPGRLFLPNARPSLAAWFIGRLLVISSLFLIIGSLLSRRYEERLPSRVGIAVTVVILWLILAPFLLIAEYRELLDRWHHELSLLAMSAPGTTVVLGLVIFVAAGRFAERIWIRLEFP